MQTIPYYSERNQLIKIKERYLLTLTTWGCFTSRIFRSLTLNTAWLQYSSKQLHVQSQQQKNTTRFPVNIYLFEVNNRNTKRCEIISKLTIKPLEQRHWGRSGVSFVNFERISYLFLVFVLLTLNNYMLAALIMLNEFKVNMKPTKTKSTDAVLVYLNISSILIHYICS